MGYAPTSISLDRRNHAASPAWSYAGYGTGASAAFSQFYPLPASAQPVRVITTALAYTTEVYPLTGIPSIVDSRNGFCFMLRAFHRPGDITYVGTTAAYSTTTTGTWTIDNVVITGTALTPSATPSASPAAGAPLSTTPTPSGTPVPQPGQPDLIATGLSGAISGVNPRTSLYGFAGQITNCGATGTPQTVAKTYVRIDLPPGTPIGGTLFVSTCGSVPTYDTQLWVGNGIPLEGNWGSFQCSGFVSACLHTLGTPSIPQLPEAAPSSPASSWDRPRPTSEREALSSILPLSHPTRPPHPPLPLSLPSLPSFQSDDAGTGACPTSSTQSVVAAAPLTSGSAHVLVAPYSNGNAGVAFTLSEWRCRPPTRGSTSAGRPSAPSKWQGLR